MIDELPNRIIRSVREKASGDFWIAMNFSSEEDEASAFEASQVGRRFIRLQPD
jgi:hypothetical protein